MRETRDDEHSGDHSLLKYRGCQKMYTDFKKGKKVY